MTTWYDPDDELTAVVQELYMTPEWMEGEHLEFKSAQNKIPKDFWNTYSAFANSLGGIVLLGVGDDGEVLGVKNVEARKTELSNALNNPNKCSINLCRQGKDIVSVELGGRVVLAVRVPQSRPDDRPVHLCGSERNSYKRNHEGDYQLKRSEIDGMLRDRGVMTALTYSADLSIVPFSSVDDLDEDSIYQFLNLARVVSVENTWVNKQPLDFLRDVQCYRRDRRTGEEGLTLAGLLMFGKVSSIGELAPGFYLDYVEYDGSEAEISGRWADRVTSDDARSGNLFRFFHRVLPKLQDGFKQRFRLSSKLGREGGSPASVAAREALVNALIHADYLGEGSVRISCYPDRLEFANPGTLLLSKEALFQPHESYCRNKVLQKLFKLMGYSEKLGSGVDKIVAGMWEQCLSRPQVEELSSPPRVVWKLPYTGLVSKEKMERQEQLIGSPYHSLTSMERLILALVPEEEGAGAVNADFCRLLAAHSADISRSLSHLAGLGYLQAVGHGRGTHYYLPEALRMQSPSHRQVMVPNKEMIVPSEEMMVPSEEMMVPSEEMMVPSEEMMVSSEETMVPNEARMESAEEASLASAVTYVQITQALNLSEELMGKLLLYRGRARHELAETKELIRELCVGRWLSVAQLSVLLDRSYQVLGRDMVRPLVQEGILLRLFDDPKHKRQAYTSAPRSAPVEQ